MELCSNDPATTPIYTGLALHFIGACLATGNLLLIAGTLGASFPAFYLRAAAEERLLRGRLGLAYDAYARRVPMLGAEKTRTAEGLAGWVKEPEVRKKYVEAFGRSDFGAMLNFYKRN